MAGTTHIVGAGLSGLSAAVKLAGEGREVVVHEAAAFAGGRCRSYYDSVIDLIIDNGNHLLLSGNWAALGYLKTIGGIGMMQAAERPEYPFVDFASGERWTLRPNEGRVPWWILASSRRVPGTYAPDYLAPIGVLRARVSATVGDVMACRGVLYDRLWRPVLLAALNTEPPEADARLAAQIIRETFAAGGHAYRPLVASGSLNAAFIDPALRYLEERRAAIRFNHSLREIDFSGDGATALNFGDGPIALDPDDHVVLAVPPVVAKALLFGLAVPERFHAILGAHFRIAPPPGQPLVLGIVNAVSEWLFAYPDRLSVTISCADWLMDAPREKLAETIWREVAVLTGLVPTLPRWQIVRERRATFAATPAEAAKRPETRTRYNNVYLAGDWTKTGLPATIEGSIRSGLSAATAIAHAAARSGQSRTAA